jgi:hypothetical protein
MIWWFLFTLLQRGLGDTLFVLNIWADATGPEAARALRGTPPSLGFPYPLDDKSKIKRGQRMSQKPVYPSAFAGSGHPISFYKLKLQGVEFNSRNVILNFGVIWLQVSIISSAGV